MVEFDESCKYYKSCGYDYCHDFDIECQDYEPVGEDGYYGEEDEK
jgi:hypothetical protein